MTTTFELATEMADADLVARSLRGDREAFSQIVRRYQTLICSLAYNVLGNLGESEDAAQETFIVAWKRLGGLREPAKLRAWLCGIAQNRARDRARRERREPAGSAEPLEAARELAAPEALPSERAINEEEQAILWRALSHMPEVYREPLILYYRESRSVERVAESLELTPDAVKQRLSRGRKLLQREVISFVEATLGRSGPGKKFTTGVLSALPAAPGLAGAGAGAVATKTAAAKSSGMAAVATGSLANACGLLLGLGAQWLILRATPSPRERKVKTLWFGAVWALVIAGWTAQPLLRLAARKFAWGASTLLLAQAVTWWLYAALLAILAVAAFRWVIEFRRRKGAEADEPSRTAGGGVARGLVMTVLVYGGNIYWVIALARRAGDTGAAWAVTAASVMLIALHYARLPGKKRDEAMKVHASQLALVWGLIILTMNLRLRAWITALGGPAIPVWWLPTLTLALLGCVGAALFLTRRNRAGAAVTL